MPEQTAFPASAAGAAPDALLTVLGRIEQHLGRIAAVMESMTTDNSTFRKELGVTRTMPTPVTKRGSTFSDENR